MSGSNLHRPGLDELLRAAEEASIDYVVAWDRNRLARPKNAVDRLLLERRLQELGKRVVYVATGQELNSSFSSELISFVEHHQNGDYLRKLSRDTMRGLVARAKTGLWPGGPIPFGFDRLILDDGTPKRVVRDSSGGITATLDPESRETLERLGAGRRYRKQDHEQCTLIPSEVTRVRAIQQLFADYAIGKPTRRVRDDLNELGFRTSRGRRFTVQTLLPMLENPAYVGRCVYNRRTFSKWHRYADGSSVERQDEGFER